MKSRSRKFWGHKIFLVSIVSGISTIAPVQTKFSYYNPQPNDTIAVNDWGCVLGLNPARHKQTALPVYDCRGHESDVIPNIYSFCFRTLKTNVDLRTDEDGYIEEVKPLLNAQL